MGLASDASGLFTSPNPFLDAKLLPMQGDLEGQSLIHDTKVLNSELSVRT